MRDRSAASRGGDGSRGKRRGKSKNSFKMNDWNVISDQSGQKLKRSECLYTWEGYLVGKNEWEPRHPQLDVRGRDEQIAVPDSRPRQPDTFSSTDADDL